MNFPILIFSACPLPPTPTPPKNFLPPGGVVFYAILIWDNIGPEVGYPEKVDIVKISITQKKLYGNVKKYIYKRDDSREVNIAKRYEGLWRVPGEVRRLFRSLVET